MDLNASYQQALNSDRFDTDPAQHNALDYLQALSTQLQQPEIMSWTSRLRKNGAHTKHRSGDCIFGAVLVAVKPG